MLYIPFVIDYLIDSFDYFVLLKNIFYKFFCLYFDSSVGPSARTRAPSRGPHGKLSNSTNLFKNRGTGSLGRE